MKKLKQLWGQRKQIWKEYRTAFYIEAVFLGAALVATGFLIHMSSKNWENKLEMMTQEIQTLIRSNTNSSRVKTGKQLSQNVYMGLTDILPYKDDIEWNSKFGINLQFTGEEGEVAYELNIPEVGCIWTTYDSENKELKKEWISLADWFHGTESDGLYQFEDFYRQEQGHVVLQKMEGYYNGTVYNIESLKFGSTDHKNKTLSINSGKNSTAQKAYRVADLNTLSAAELTEDMVLEQGSMDLFVYLPSGIVSANLVNTPYKCQTYAEGTIGGYDLSGYQISMYADTLYLSTHDGALKNYMVPIWLLGQGVAVLLIVVVLYMQKKRKELASLRNAFINAMAHEMKTPAAVIKNSAECLEEGIHPEKQSHYIEMMQKEADHMNELLMSMLTYTRLSDSVCELEKTDCSLEEMMKQSCLRYREQIEDKKLNVIWDSTENTTTRCDEKLINVVLDNFISNAVRFGEKDGVIRFTLSPGSVSVYNDGAQIPEEQRKEIWTPMYKGDSARKETQGTSGMGLAISAVILKAHRASYGANNVPGGVEFYFKLH